NVVDADQVKVDPPFSLQKQAKHIVHFNPTFDESSFVNVAVKEGVLEAKNHSTVVFKNSNILESVNKETGMAAELIASEIDGKSTMDLLRKKGDRSVSIRYDHLMAIRDFKAILSSDNKKDSHVKGYRCQFFGEFMDKVQLRDLGFHGPYFTWHRSNLFERLDRAVGNDDWMESFPNCSEVMVRDKLENILHHEEMLWTKKIKNLYGEKLGLLGILPPSTFTSLSPEDVDFLGRNVTNKEIRITLFDMAPLKVTGSDGFHAAFFQNQWDNIGGAIYE
ncbi:hypothetical protein Golax_005377, partial [Gossypium laxum]|nr:hypothetical protein [Gossypium laxum]